MPGPESEKRQGLGEKTPPKTEKPGVKTRNPASLRTVNSGKDGPFSRFEALIFDRRGRFSRSRLFVCVFLREGVYWALLDLPWGDCGAVDETTPERLALPTVWEREPREDVHVWHEARRAGLRGGLRTHATFGCVTFQVRGGRGVRVGDDDPEIPTGEPSDLGG
jgi:hypothetical protein